MKNYPSLFKHNSRDWKPSLKQPEPANAFTHKPVHNSCFASFSQHLCSMLGVSVHRLHVWCRSRNKLNSISTTSFKVSQMSCLAFLCPVGEMQELHLISRLCKEKYELWKKEPGFLQVCLPVNWLWCRLCCKILPLFFKMGLFLDFYFCLFYLIVFKHLWGIWIFETSAPVWCFNKHLK